jgi:hypothetical protein
MYRFLPGHGSTVVSDEALETIHEMVAMAIFGTMLVDKSVV